MNRNKITSRPEHLYTIGIKHQENGVYVATLDGKPMAGLSSKEPELLAENNTLKEHLITATQNFDKCMAELSKQMRLNEVLIDENVKLGLDRAQLSEQLLKQHGILVRLAEATDTPIETKLDILVELTN